MELVTARLRIDALRPDDTAALFALRSDPQWLATRAGARMRGEWVDETIFALLDHEWRAAQRHRG